MLMMIGPVLFKVAPFNATEYSHEHGGQFAEKPVLGARSPLEWTGKAAETWSIRANLFPERFGGQSNLVTLGLLASAGLPQYMARGDGSLMGWVVIEKVRERSTFLDASGVGKVIDVDIDLRRSQPPSAASYFGALSSVFGGLF
jgi:hypothetical protein